MTTFPVYANYDSARPVGHLEIDDSITPIELSRLALVPGMTIRVTGLDPDGAEDPLAAEVDVQCFGLIPRTHVDTEPDERLGE